MKKPMMLEVLDTGSGFVFKCVAPVLLVSLITLPFLIEYKTWQSVAVMIAWQAASLLLLLALYDVRRFHWALRALCALVFLAYVVFLLDGLIQDPADGSPPVKVTASRVIGAIAIFFTVAVPALSYALMGRLGFAEDSDADGNHHDDDDAWTDSEEPRF